MRKVAGYSISTNLGAMEDALQTAEKINSIVDKWVGTKGTIQNSNNSGKIQYKDGRQADYTRSETISTSGRLIEHDLIEPTETGLFQVHIGIGTQERQLAVYVELKAAGDAYHVQPLQFDVRCPQVIRDILGSGERWVVGDTPARTKPIVFSGSSDGTTLIQAIWHGARNLPIVVVSRHEGATLTDQITTKLASDLCGLALVADIDDEVSRYLTSKKGKEWSCFNGGIRLYWPMRFRAQDPYAHPLWIRSSLLSGVTEVRDVSYRIRRQLRRKILGLSAFSVWARVFRRIRNEARRQELEIIKSKTTSDDDWKQLAEAYAHDNGEL